MFFNLPSVGSACIKKKKKYSSSTMYKGYLVNRLKFLSYSKDGLNVVITQLLDQVSNRRIVLLNIQNKLLTKNMGHVKVQLMNRR